MEILANLLGNQGEIPKFASWTMRNISDNSSFISNPGNLSKQLVHALQHPKYNVVNCVVGTISNLTVNNETLKLAVCEADGIQALLSTNRKYGNRTELLERAMSALKHLIIGHSRVDDAQKMFVINCGGLQDLKRWLVPETPRTVLKPILGILSNLARKDFNHEILHR